MDKTLEALLSSAMAGKASLVRDRNLDKFTLVLLSLEILGLARSLLHSDGTRSWFATDELGWLASRDYISVF